MTYEFSSMICKTGKKAYEIYKPFFHQNNDFCFLKTYTYNIVPNYPRNQYFKNQEKRSIVEN